MSLDDDLLCPLQSSGSTAPPRNAVGRRDTMVCIGTSGHGLGYKLRSTVQAEKKASAQWGHMNSRPDLGYGAGPAMGRLTDGGVMVPQETDMRPVQTVSEPIAITQPVEKPVPTRTKQNRMEQTRTRAGNRKIHHKPAWDRPVSDSNCDRLDEEIVQGPGKFVEMPRACLIDQRIRGQR